MSYMFKSFLESLPKDRYDYVSDLKPEEVSLPPYVLRGCDDDLSLSGRSDSLSSLLDDDDRSERRGSVNTDSSIALSRAMTDSDVDYDEHYRRIKNKIKSDPWFEMKTALDAFPSDYLNSLKSFQSSDSETKESESEEWVNPLPLRDDPFLARIERFLEEECTVFTPDDPSLEVLTDALENVDLENLAL